MGAIGSHITTSIWATYGGKRKPHIHVNLGHGHGPNWHGYIASCYPYVWPCPWPKNGFLLPPYMAMPVVQIDVDICPPFAPIYGHAYGPNLAFYYPHTWPCPWPKLTWIYTLLLPPYMAIPIAYITNFINRITCLLDID